MEVNILPVPYQRVRVQHGDRSYYVDVPKEGLAINPLALRSSCYWTCQYPDGEVLLVEEEDLPEEVVVAAAEAIQRME